jgi:hypothetical protein
VSVHINRVYIENALMVSKRIRRIRGKYMSVNGEYDKFRIVDSTHNRLQILGKYLNVFGEYAERNYAYMENTQRDSWHILLIRQET